MSEDDLRRFSNCFYAFSLSCWKSYDYFESCFSRRRNENDETEYEDYDDYRSESLSLEYVFDDQTKDGSEKSDESNKETLKVIGDLEERKKLLKERLLFKRNKKQWLIAEKRNLKTEGKHLDTDGSLSFSYRKHLLLISYEDKEINDLTSGINQLKTVTIHMRESLMNLRVWNSIRMGKVAISDLLDACEDYDEVLREADSLLTDSKNVSVILSGRSYESRAYYPDNYDCLEKELRDLAKLEIGTAEEDRRRDEKEEGGPDKSFGGEGNGKSYVTSALPRRSDLAVAVENI